ncbi:hypothetical protein ABVK25_000957 [Lepraria finkii]|uniref:Uncharacterized protein n=1 Tax=Lepraria finkii TaxID=1340010 RepID=A0ABR4BPC8_9LECA
MGSSQSTVPEIFVPQKPSERPEALTGKEDKIQPKQDYAYIDKSMEQRPTSPCSPTVSISTTDQWEKELMEDPKVYFILYYDSLKNSSLTMTEPACALCPLFNRP